MTQPLKLPYRGKRLKISHICPQFKEVHGGGETVLFRLFREFADLGYDNVVHTFKISGSMSAFMDDRVTVKGPPGLLEHNIKNPLLESLIDLVGSPFTLFKVDKDSDMVCFYTETTVPAMFFYKLFVRKPCVYYCFQPPRFAYDAMESSVASGGGSRLFRILVPLFSAFYRKFDTFTAKMADKIVVFSGGYKEWVERLYGAKDARVLPPGVERPANLRPLPGEIAEKIGPESKVMVFSGKFVTKKNIDRAINIVELVSKKIPEVKLLLVGDGPERENLKTLTREKELENTVIFTGFVDNNDDVFSYYNASHLAILLEKNVSFGLFLTEAAICGAPSVAFEGGGPSDIVKNGYNGQLFSEDASDERIADYVTACFSDPALLENLRKGAIESAERYDWRSFAKSYADIIIETIK